MIATGLPALAAEAIGAFAFLIALIVARSRRDRRGEGGAANGRSIAGIALQGASYAVVAARAVDVSRDPLSAGALMQAAVVAVTMGSAVAIFVAATRAMGRNWSLVARTREDHALVEHGPFAHVRHPIYAAMALALIALAIALGHIGALVFAAPWFAAGTWLRVREEERLLHAAFGAGYDDYVRRVRRFVPGVL
jgi:protein-S-isoprenylcysteine O-methyltransferase Ste14